MDPFVQMDPKCQPDNMIADLIADDDCWQKMQNKIQ